jgi:2-keto-4-pentenoate hydratase
MRMARGERPSGWKIGFTNRTIWDEYGVHAPIWGPMYDSTLQQLPPGPGPFPVDLRGLVEPRIEPEIVLRIAKAAKSRHGPACLARTASTPSATVSSFVSPVSRTGASPRPTPSPRLRYTVCIVAGPLIPIEAG